MDNPPDPKDLRKIRRRLLAWFGANRRSFPWRKTRNPWRILVAEVLLRQTGAAKVAPVYRVFMKRWRTPKCLLRAREQDVRRLIQPLGLHYRAAQIMAIAQDVVSRFGGRVPATEEELLSIKGVGDYTASAILCHAYGKRTPTVDANIIRLVKRLNGLASPVSKLYADRNVKYLARRMLPRMNAGAFNYALLDFCALVCRFYRPACRSCPISGLCELRPNL